MSAGGDEPLHQQHQEADIVTLFPHSLVIALADVLRHGVVESCLSAVPSLPDHSSKLRTSGLEERVAIGVNGAAFLRADDIRTDALLRDTTNIRKSLCIDQ